MADDFEMQLEKTQKRYNKICENLEVLDAEAFELEGEIMYLTAKVKENQNKLNRVAQGQN